MAVTVFIDWVYSACGRLFLRQSERMFFRVLFFLSLFFAETIG